VKTIGVLGGMSWESTAVYYRRLNELVQEKLGGLASAPVIIHSFDFAEIERLQHEEAWGELAAVLSRAAAGLREAGADFLVIATNTMHLVAPQVASASGLPLLHIADVTAREITAHGYTRVALLGTRFTMERPFYAARIEETAGARCIVPDDNERETVHRIIYDELCAGTVRDSSREQVVSVIERLAGAGAEAVVLGCTELPLLVRPGDVSIPVLDTTELHVRAAVARAIS
jgi:aspartate racemase